MWTNTVNRIFRGLTLLFAALLVVAIGAAITCESWYPMLDEYLGTQSYKIVTEQGDEEDTYLFKPDYENTNDLVAAHKDLAERTQEEGSVLLKNEDALPLDSGAKISLLGMRSQYPQYGGQIGSSAPAAQNIDPVTAFKAKGFDVNPTMASVYSKLGNIITGYSGSAGTTPVYGHQPNRLSNSFGVGYTEAKYAINEPAVSLYAEQESGYEPSLNQYNDAAVVFFGRPSTEAADFFPGARGTESAGARNVLGLSTAERAVLDVAKANFTTIIVIINSDSAMEIEELKTDEDVDAILWVGAVGNYGFLGVADILKGDANPSGHLADIYATDSTSSPAMMNFGNISFTNKTDIETGDTTNYRGMWYLIQAEGIYTGYRYYETRYEDVVLGQGGADSTAGTKDSTGAWSYAQEVSYPFGYGMSYSTFKQTLGDVEIASDRKTAKVTVTVENIDGPAGKDVVQVYAQTPYSEYDKENGVEKSAVQLMDFAKTKLLAKGEKDTLTLDIDMQNLASYDYTTAKTYVLAEGDYYFSIGNGSHEAINNILAAKDKTMADGMDAEGDASKTYTWEWKGVADKTFATSKSGTAITNRIDNGDFNYYKPDTITYLSRDKWDTTWPADYSGLAAPASMITQLRNDTYTISTTDDVSAIKWDQPGDIRIADLKNADYDDDRWAELLDKLNLQEAMTAMHLGMNQVLGIKSIGLLKTFVSDGPMGSHNALGTNADYKGDMPWMINETDANYGFDFRTMPTAVVIGSTFNKNIAFENGVLFGNDSLYNNVTIMWAPGSNLHRTPYNGRNHEYYSEDPILAGYLSSSVCQGGLTKGLIMAPKHFAFNDQETNRAAVAPFMNEQKARELELRGFQIPFENGALGTMTAFNRIGATFVNAHTGVMNDILRGEWAYHGYIVTDMINGSKYMTMKESVIAGLTNADTGTAALTEAGGDWSYWTAAGVAKDAKLQSQIKRSMHDLLYVLVNSNAFNGINASSKQVWQLTWWRGTYITLIVVTSVLAVAAAAVYALGAVRARKEGGM